MLISIAAISLLFVRLAPGGKVSGAALSASARVDRTADAKPSEPISASSTPAAPGTPATLNRNAPILPSNYEVQPGQHFAEIRLHRPGNRRRDAPLIWWTEPASAKAGVDYVSQAKVSQSFPKGQDSMSVFVKLLPKARRSQTEVFYIAVADRSDKHAGEIAHTAVRLPPTPTSSLALIN